MFRTIVRFHQYYDRKRDRASDEADQMVSGQFPHKDILSLSFKDPKSLIHLYELSRALD